MKSPTNNTLSPEIATAIIKDAVALGQALNVIRNETAVPFIIVPNDCRVESLDKLQHPFGRPPERKVGIVTLHDAVSFARYYDLFCDAHSRIFASAEQFTLTAVLDYHEAGDGRPRFGQHKAFFQARLTDEWKAWKTSSGRKMSQVEFAEFIEDNAPDVVEPASARMLEVARDLNAKQEVDFASSVRLDNGQVQFKYQENIKGSVGVGQTEVPETFKIRIPVFFGGEPFTITARLRYRINSGKLTMWYDLLRAGKLADEAFRATVARVEEATKAQILYGAV